MVTIGIIFLLLVIFVFFGLLGWVLDIIWAIFEFLLEGCFNCLGCLFWLFIGFVIVSLFFTYL